MKYYINGVAYRESSRSSDRNVAELLLKEKRAAAMALCAAADTESATQFLVDNEEALARILLRSNLGTAAELIVCADLMTQGFEVFRAASQHASCDLIVLKDGRCCKVEVKTALLDKNNRLNFSIQRNAGRFDLLAVIVRGKGIYYGWATENLRDLYWMDKLSRAVQIPESWAQSSGTSEPKLFKTGVAGGI